MITARQARIRQTVSRIQRILASKLRRARTRLVLKSICKIIPELGQGAAKADHTKAKGGDKQKTKVCGIVDLVRAKVDHSQTDISPSAGGHADTAGTYHKGDQQKTRPDTPNKPKVCLPGDMYICSTCNRIQAEKETPKKVDDGKTDKAKASKAQTNSDTKQGDRDAAVDKAKVC